MLNSYQDLIDLLITACEEFSIDLLADENFWKEDISDGYIDLEDFKKLKQIVYKARKVVDTIDGSTAFTIIFPKEIKDE